jgi:hypothetical protein
LIGAMSSARETCQPASISAALTSLYFFAIAADRSPPNGQRKPPRPVVSPPFASRELARSAIAAPAADARRRERLSA